MPYAELDSSEYESTTVIYVTIMCIDDHFLKCRVDSDKFAGFFSGIVSNEYFIGMLYVIYWVIRWNYYSFIFAQCLPIDLLLFKALFIPTARNDIGPKEQTFHNSVAI